MKGKSVFILVSGVYPRWVWIMSVRLYIKTKGNNITFVLIVQYMAALNDSTNITRKGHMEKCHSHRVKAVHGYPLTA